jgi:hypothetical protein
MKVTIMKTKYLLSGGVVLLLLAFVVGVTYAVTDNGVIHACVKDNGQVRIVNAASDCKGQETHIQWNIVGPQGPKGDTGSAGPQGIQGPQGVQGAPGNLGLANQSCPPFNFVTGFAANGSLICSTYEQPTVQPPTPVPTANTCPSVPNATVGYYGGVCSIVACAPDYYDMDGQYDNGCECHGAECMEPPVDATATFLACSANQEICGNGIDDNCNGVVDEPPCMQP